MTEQSKIPLPGTGPSLIERATKGLDLSALPRPVLPPVPAHRAPATGKAHDFAPAQAEPALQPRPEAAAAEPGRTADGKVSLPEKPHVLAFKGPYHAIDRMHLREQCLIEPDGPITGILEEFRIVKRQLLLAAADSRAGNGAPHGERVLVCSAHSGEGKTFCAVNLALSLAAEKDTEVLLVDADFAKPSVLSTLGMPGGPGFMDALADPSLAVEDCILGTDIPGLWVLPAGNSTGSDTEYLASSRTAAVLDRLTAQGPNRMIIFDSPPALAASPASELAMHVGQAVMVVRADRTGEAALRDALNILSGCEDIKLLLNCTKFSPTGRRFGSYYGYKE
ncbi:MAG: capsular biosynthesis protein [Sphingomonadales bacterium]|nr:capsular biosynthesis protein [Sphingomonadales bacterium]MDE2570073.1 capsular biosynthesis protein [Sphingomonadales bacterium]